MMTGLRLNFPGNSMEEIITALRNEAPISSLGCKFTNDNFNTSEELREAMLNNNISGRVSFLHINNYCRNRDTHKRCFDFYLRCLEGPENKIGRFAYDIKGFPLTLADAKRFAVAIASNDSIDLIAFFYWLRDGVVHEEGTLECIFNAVFENGVENLCLTTTPRATNSFVKRVFTSKLASNTTLKILNFSFIQAGARTYLATDESNEGIKQLANILKVNKGLSRISIPFPIITNIGRRYLLESLRDNTTLVQLNTRKISVVAGRIEGEVNRVEEDEIERDESLSLQSQIDRHMMLNTIWGRLATNNNNDNSKSRASTISLDIYPDLLEKLAEKPLLLFLFMQQNHPLIFTSFSTDQSRKHRRRRSMRILKKKRRKVVV
jgi:hypothetical protein